jgi:hypothetical protein
MSRWTPEDNLLFSMLQGVPVERAKKKARRTGAYSFDVIPIFWQFQ